VKSSLYIQVLRDGAAETTSRSGGPGTVVRTRPSCPVVFSGLSLPYKVLMTISITGRFLAKVAIVMLVVGLIVGNLLS
jgi:hypothetical protein